MSDQTSQLKYRLMGFTVSIVLIGLLGAPWLRTTSLEPESSPPRYTPDFSSGAGLLQDREDLVSLLVVLYLVMALIVLVRSRPGAVIFGGIGGLLTTLLILSADSDWTGAPVVALGLWAIIIVIGFLAWKES